MGDSLRVDRKTREQDLAYGLNGRVLSWHNRYRSLRVFVASVKRPVSVIVWGGAVERASAATSHGRMIIGSERTNMQPARN